MGNEVMLRDFPKRERRAAVCYSQWKKSKGEDIEETKKEEKKEPQNDMKEVVDSIVDRNKK